MPITVKLGAHPLPEALAELAKWSVEGGAHALSVNHALVGFIGVDIETGVALSLYLHG